jgi:hypothetical protein
MLERDLKAEREASPPSGRDYPAALSKCRSQRRAGQEIIQRDATALPTGLKNGSLIAVSDIDRVFNDLQIKKLAKGALGDDPQVAQSVRDDARLFIKEKGHLSNARLREAITKLYKLTARAEGDDRAAGSLARARDATPSDVWDWLAYRNPEAGDVPTAAEIVSKETRASAVQRLRNILTIGQKRATGKNSQRFEALLWAPKSEPHRPRSNAERDFVRNLGLTYSNATGKTPPYKVDFQSRGPFSQFVHECFELVGAPSGSVTRLINELGQERRAAPSRKIEHRDDARRSPMRVKPRRK